MCFIVFSRKLHAHVRLQARLEDYCTVRTWLFTMHVLLCLVWIDHGCDHVNFILAQTKAITRLHFARCLILHRLLLITMPPTPNQSVMDRFHAARSRADDLLLKLRLKRVYDTLKLNKGELYRVKKGLVEKGLLENLPMHSNTPQSHQRWKRRGRRRRRRWRHEGVQSQHQLFPRFTV